MLFSRLSSQSAIQRNSFFYRLGKVPIIAKKELEKKNRGDKEVLFREDQVIIQIDVLKKFAAFGIIQFVFNNFFLEKLVYVYLGVGGLER